MESLPTGCCDLDLRAVRVRTPRGNGIKFSVEAH